MESGTMYRLRKFYYIDVLEGCTLEDDPACIVAAWAQRYSAIHGQFQVLLFEQNTGRQYKAMITAYFVPRRDEAHDRAAREAYAICSLLNADLSVYNRHYFAEQLREAGYTPAQLASIPLLRR